MLKFKEGGETMAGMNVAIKPEIISWILQVIQFDNEIGRASCRERV